MTIATHGDTIRFMIKSFKCKETEKLFNRQFSRKLQQTIQGLARRKLLMLDEARTLEDLKIPPSLCLEKLVGNRKGQYSIRINNQWRICFKWFDGEKSDVEIVDYH